ncbi:AAA family ATPase [Planomicrobium sp. Y74]|uniref:AAA family ATPase n=1 Tax=Planomicrobium sp. Y74 TaxID=2478977 RepID=UPI000EF4AC1E|nr:AAA family ATPase [Planomicrobium sp. Y74]RLQ89829.1 ATP-binding protein [Planomicrobium sp. Y74]
MIFIQMSGFPGSGKSALSREIAQQFGAVIVDHDVVKSSLMESIEDAPIDSKLAGKIAYNIDWSLVEFHLSQGFHVILDSPCLYNELVEKGIFLCEKYNATYKYVECYLDDMNEINRRLKTRNRMVSQIGEVLSPEAFTYTIANSKKPVGYEILTINTDQPLEAYLQEVINYLKT